MLTSLGGLCPFTLKEKLMTQDQTSMTDSSEQASVSPSSPGVPAFGKPGVVNAVQRGLVGFMGVNPSFS